MSFVTKLFGGGKSQASQQAEAAGISVQTSVNGKPVPLVYGTSRVAPNLIWYGFFNATQGGASAGKGGVSAGAGGKGGGSAGYQYSASFLLALCEGPIGGVEAVYYDKNLDSPAGLGLGVMNGYYGQQPWSYLVTQSTPVTEAHTIPSGGPYGVSVAQGGGLIQDGGVTGTTVTAFTAVLNNPGPSQYALTSTPLGNMLYVFNAARAGQTVDISYQTPAGGVTTVPEIVPPGGVLTLSVSSYGYADKGVTLAASPFTAVAGSPGANQYSVSGGTYTFSSANAGQAIQITYYASTTAGNEGLPYSGVCYLAAADYSLGGSPQLPNFNAVVAGLGSYPVGTVPDADPAFVVIDLLTNAHYGIGFPPARLGDTTAYSNYCMAAGLWISPVYDSQAATNSLLTDIARATNSDYVWSEGLLKVVPYGDTPLAANGYAYAPPATPLFSLTDDDFLPNQNATNASGNTDPVVLTRTRPSDAFNCIPLEYLDRNNNYAPAIVQAQDQAAIDRFGLRQDATRPLHMFCDPNAAQVSVWLQLQRQAVRNVYQFTLDQRYVLLDPMDIVAITDAALGLDEQPVRILEITENDDMSLSVTAEEYLQGIAHTPLYSFQAGSGFSANYNAAPSPVNLPVLFEPPAELSESLEVWMAVSGGPDWGGCDVYLSADGASFKMIGTVTGGCRTGLLTAALPAVSAAATGQTIDPADTLSVDISEGGGQLLSGTIADATALNTLCYVDGELLAYETATLLGSGQYALTTLVRGAYGSAIGPHAAASAFARLDDNVFSFAYAQNQIGQTVYIKLASFNLYGGGRQAIAEAPTFSYQVQGTALTTPLPDVANLTSVYVAGITQLSWDAVSDFRPVQYEVRKGAAWLGAQLLGRAAQPPFATQGNGTYWVSAFSQPAAGITVYSENPQDVVIAGAQIVSNVVASYDEAATGWGGTVSGDAVILGGGVVTTGTLNILAQSSFLTLANILYAGGEGNGTYEIPAGHEVNVGRVAPCNVLITTQAVGQHIDDNVLTAADFLNFPDLLDAAASANISVYPEIALSQDGVTWGAWRKYVSGTYSAQKFKARVQLVTLDPAVEAILEGFTFAVDVPDRDDHYVGLSVPSGGRSLTFTPDGSAAAPFLGGPAGASVPAVQVTIINASAGDQLLLTGVSLSGCTVQVTNGGGGVARTVNVLAQGY